MKICILGGGLAGLSAAYHLRDKDYFLLEKENKVGGLCSSKKINDYTFDYAPHILFTNDDYVKDLILNLLGKNLVEKERRAYIYTNGVFVKYPFEANLRPLPKEIIEECINGVIEIEKIEPKNFKEWIYSTFGKGIAKYYMESYNEKIWKYDLDKINLDWVGSRVPSPSVEDMRKGAFGKQRKEFGPNAKFLYPKYGGIGALSESFLSHIKNLSLGSEVTEIKFDDDEIVVVFKTNEKTKKMNCRRIFSSLPLPELIKMIPNVPEDVIKAAKNLIFNSLICFNLGVKRPKISDKHWVYFPEKEFIFHRISFPMNLSRFTTPEKRSSMLVEITHKKDEELMIDEVKEKVIGNLIDAKIIRKDNELEVCDICKFKYAYVIYDPDHRKNVTTIHNFLKEKNIIPIGRFGEWEYINMDKSILSGKKAAMELNEGIE